MIDLAVGLVAHIGLYQILNRITDWYGIVSVWNRKRFIVSKIHKSLT